MDNRMDDGKFHNTLRHIDETDGKVWKDYQSLINLIDASPNSYSLREHIICEINVKGDMDGVDAIPYIISKWMVRLEEFGIGEVEEPQPVLPAPSPDIDMEELVMSVALDYFNDDVDAARDYIIYLLREEAGMGIIEISKKLDMAKSTVSKVYGRMEKAADGDRSISEMREQIRKGSEV
ncbi:MAG: hypothetical protein SVY53_05260 [Chloroflexota bacterium]|nr:hypothetical protein [Chloroflexota bacterium]